MRDAMTTFFGGTYTTKLAQVEWRTTWEFTCMDEDTMRHFGIFQEASSYLEVEHIPRLFKIQGQGYLESTLEFLCTLRVDVDDLLNEMPMLITFRAAGMTVSISMQRFCMVMGLYTEEEMEDPSYEWLTYALASFPYATHCVGTTTVERASLPRSLVYPYFTLMLYDTSTESWPGQSCMPSLANMWPHIGMYSIFIAWWSGSPCISAMDSCPSCGSSSSYPLRVHTLEQGRA